MSQYLNLIYDFSRRVYDIDWWKTKAGTPSVVGDYLVLNNASTSMLADFLEGTVEYSLFFQTAPTAGHLRQFGWKSPSNEYAIFGVSGTVFQASVRLANGTTYTQALSWDPLWTGTVTTFSIKWDASGFSFYINGEKKTGPVISGESFSPEGMYPFIVNAVADNLGVAYVAVKDYTQMFRALNAMNNPITQLTSPVSAEVATPVEEVTVTIA